MAHRSSSSIARSAACLGSGSENSPALPFDWHMSNELFVLLFFPSHFSYFIFFFGALDMRTSWSVLSNFSACTICV